MVLVGGRILCSIQKQLLDKRALVPASSMMQGSVFAVICLSDISSMLSVGSEYINSNLATCTFYF